MSPFYLMIQFNECRVDHEGNRLVIEASVENMEYYRHVYIDSVIIDTDKTWSPNGPSDKPVFQVHYEPEHMKVDVLEDCNSLKYDKECRCGDIYTSSKEGIKNVRLYVDAKDMDIKSIEDNIFFVYVYATGVPSPDTPCGMDNTYAMCVIMDTRPLYDRVMKHIREIEGNCSVPRNFIDMFLRMKAFEYSLRTGNYSESISQWEKLKGTGSYVESNTGCGCHAFYRGNI